MRLEDKELKVFDASFKLILKAPLLKQRTFKILIKMLDPQRLTSTTYEDQK